MANFIDLSGYIEEGQPVFPSAQDTQIWATSTHEEGGYAMRQRVEEETETIRRKLAARRAGSTELHPTVRTLVVSEHGPTHVDALSHLKSTAADQSIDRLPLEWFYTPAVGVDVSSVSADDLIEIEDIQSSLDEHGLEIEEGDAITLYTGHRDRHYSTDDLEAKYRYLHEYTGLSEEAAYWLGEQGIRNIGIDTPSIDHADARPNGSLPAHDMCAEYEVLNMEQMENLDEVVGLRYTLCAFPLKIAGGTGSPVRPVAIVED